MGEGRRKGEVRVEGKVLPVVLGEEEAGGKDRGKRKSAAGLPSLLLTAGSLPFLDSEIREVARARPFICPRIAWSVSRNEGPSAESARRYRRRGERWEGAMVEHSLQKRSAEEASMPDCRTEPWPFASNDTAKAIPESGRLSESDFSIRGPSPWQTEEGLERRRGGGERSWLIGASCQSPTTGSLTSNGRA